MSTKDKNIAFFGCKTTTLECMQKLLDDGFKIDLLVTLSPEQGKKNQVAGYCNLKDFAIKNNIKLLTPNNYSLKNQQDEDMLKQYRLDIVLVIGWQRLIPEWLLDHISVGAFGMHGSPEPLPRGRGRSPLNWSLLHGKTSFLTHLFKYDPGIDSGEVIDFQKFEINSWDDCNSLHFKNRISMNRLLKKHLPNILNDLIISKKQPTDIEPTYFEKRIPEDGRIIWQDHDMISLYNHIRCQTKPFPGAFTYLNNQEKCYIWRATPFDGFLLNEETKPGYITEVFHDGSFLTSVWDGSIRVIEYEMNSAPQIGMQFLDSVTKD